MELLPLDGGEGREWHVSSSSDDRAPPIYTLCISKKSPAPAPVHDGYLGPAEVRLGPALKPANHHLLLLLTPTHLHFHIRFPPLLDLSCQVFFFFFHSCGLTHSQVSHTGLDNHHVILYKKLNHAIQSLEVYVRFH